MAGSSEGIKNNVGGYIHRPQHSWHATQVLASCVQQRDTDLLLHVDRSLRWGGLLHRLSLLLHQPHSEHQHCHHQQAQRLAAALRPSPLAAAQLRLRQPWQPQPGVLAQLEQTTRTDRPNSPTHRRAMDTAQSKHPLGAHPSARCGARRGLETLATGADSRQALTNMFALTQMW